MTIHGGGLPGLCGFACASYGIYVEGPNNLIDGCNIYDTSGAGVQIYNSTGDAPDNNIIRNNRIHDITRTGSLDEVWGIIRTGANNQIYNNVIYNISVGNINQGNAAIPWPALDTLKSITTRFTATPCGGLWSLALDGLARTSATTSATEIVKATTSTMVSARSNQTTCLPILIS